MAHDTFHDVQLQSRQPQVETNHPHKISKNTNQIVASSRDLRIRSCLLLLHRLFWTPPTKRCNQIAGFNIPTYPACWRLTNKSNVASEFNGRCQVSRPSANLVYYGLMGLVPSNLDFLNSPNCPFSFRALTLFLGELARNTKTSGSIHRRYSDRTGTTKVLTFAIPPLHSKFQRARCLSFPIYVVAPHASDNHSLGYYSSPRTRYEPFYRQASNW